MNHKIKFLTLSFMLIFLSVFGQSYRRQLTVSLYPIIPNADNFYRKVETQFEKQNPEIDLIIKLNTDNYYDESKGINSISKKMI